ncbi:MAG: PIG-L family deacetylase [Gemmatimonadetes bacterium]|nr:PIG-L family deacetylase [Gemmatimonadota bacterium]
MAGAGLARRVACLLVGVAMAAARPGAGSAQSMEGDEGGTVATGLLLRQMNGVKRVLMIGAHPDDEDTSLLTALARGEGVQTAYLSLTRGEGGQNAIGPELWDGLGIIRTGELEAARRLDGGIQFFTRAFDFGYSKTAKETLTFWPHDEILSDVVWIIRKFRPQVVVTVFTGTPRDGHGNHQAAGILAREAFAVAGDPSRFPEQLKEGVEAWAPEKLYQLTRWNRMPSSITIQTGTFDPLLGRSYYQLAMESRSQHRSQDMGNFQPPGPQTSGVMLLKSNVPETTDQSIFSGVDTTLTGLTKGLPQGMTAEARARLEAYEKIVTGVEGDLDAMDPSASAPLLARALDDLDQAEQATRSADDVEIHDDLSEKIDVASRAFLAAAGVVVDARSDDDIVVPGQAVHLTVQAWNGGPMVLRGAKASLRLPKGWVGRQVGSDGLAPDGSVAPGTMATWTYEITIPADAPSTRMYYLRQPRDGDIYRWPKDHPELWGLPRAPAPVSGGVAFSVQAGGKGVEVHHEVPWSYVGVDRSKGQYRDPVLVVPAISASVTPGSLIWPQERMEPHTLTVAVRNEAKGGSKGHLRLEAPAGWTVRPAGYDVALGDEGTERSFSFEVSPAGAAAAGDYEFHAVVVTDDGHQYRDGYELIDYPHIQRTPLFAPASAKVTVVPVRIAQGLKVGYIMGPGDDGPEAIRQLGAEVHLITPDQVRAGDFLPYDVVVLGVRAYQARPDLVAANQQLLDYARAGGTVVSQYNQYEYPRNGYAPYPVEMNRPADRVTDETAEVTILQPDAPIFTTPNKIGPNDFKGWVQERGLYFLSKWDDHFTPLLQMHDPDEAPTRGSLLVAPVGNGVYVYAALSFFRQFPAGVPGAYRLFANIISLKAADWRKFEAKPISDGN